MGKMNVLFMSPYKVEFMNMKRSALNAALDRLKDENGNLSSYLGLCYIGTYADRGHLTLDGGESRKEEYKNALKIFIDEYLK